MGKDREGTYHPPKGKPSGTGKENSTELHLTGPNALEQYLEIAGKYTAGEEEMPVNAPIRHPNRNVDKGAERQVEKSQKAGSKNNKSKNDTFTEERSQVVAEELPGILTKDLFVELAGHQADTCISVYLPTHRTGQEVNDQRDSINFKNSLQSLSNTLKERGLNQTQIQLLLEPGYELLRDEKFWTNLDKGLGVFIAENFCKYIKLPIEPKEETLISTSFQLKPLVPVMTNKDYFFVLVISKKQAKFFKADAFGIHHIQIDELPNGVDDVVHFEEKDDQKLFRTDTAGAGQGANFHGHGAGKPDEKEHIALYLEEVDDTLWQAVLHNENVPLLLIGVEYLLPIYKSVTDYKHIWNETITGSHEHDDLNTLFQLVREKMQPYFEERVKKALTNYGNNSATELTSSIPADVIPAAYYGRIWHLFVQEDEHIWGSFDEMENDLKIHEVQQEGDECLVDKAVIKTLLTGGDVHFLRKEHMPADSKIAALMRY